MFQFTQFVIIGMTNAVVDLGSMNLLLICFPTKLHLLLLLYNSAAYTLTMIDSYILNSRITFKKHSDRTAIQRFHYIVQVVICFLVSNAVFIGSVFVAERLFESAWLAQNISKLMSMVLSSLTSFYLMKYYVFHKRKSKSL